MKILSLMTLVFFNSVFAITCPDINLYEKTHLTRNIKNQGDMHTCYAHSLSALYESEYQTHINPYWIAYIHKDRLLHWQPHDLNFSLLSWAFNDLKKKGICSKNTITENLRSFKASTQYSDDQYFYLVQIYFKKESDPEKLFIYLMNNSKDFKRAWKKSEVKQLANNIKNSNAKNLFEFLDKNIFRNCEHNSKTLGELTNTARGFESNKKLLSIITENLSQHKALSIGLCPDAAYKYKTKDIKTRPRILKSVKSKCGAHYVNIVGSRQNNNQCELLIRNSYPGFWAHESLTCLCEKNGITLNCTKNNFKESDRVLGCWVPSEKVLTNTYDLSFFE